MMPRLSKTLTNIYNVAKQTKSEIPTDLYAFPSRRFSKLAAVDVPVASNAANLKNLFRSEPCSLSLPPESPLRIKDPNFPQILLDLEKLDLKDDIQPIPATHDIYRRVITQADSPSIYHVFKLQKLFITKLFMLEAHMLLLLQRLGKEGGLGNTLGAHVTAIFNHDLKVRASKSGVSDHLSDMRKEMDGILNKNYLAFSTRVNTPNWEELMWKGDSVEDNSSDTIVRVLTRYLHREYGCLPLIDKEALFTGNFLFTSFENLNPNFI